MQFNITSVGEGLAPPAAETVRRVVRYADLDSISISFASTLDKFLESLYNLK